DVDAEAQRDDVRGGIADRASHYRIEVALPAKPQACQIPVVTAAHQGRPRLARSVRRAAVRDRATVGGPSWTLTTPRSYPRVTGKREVAHTGLPKLRQPDLDVLRTRLNGHVDAVVSLCDGEPMRVLAI